MQVTLCPRPSITRINALIPEQEAILGGLPRFTRPLSEIVRDTETNPTYKRGLYSASCRAFKNDGTYAYILHMRLRGVLRS
jgi:hypothetical protein